MSDSETIGVDLLIVVRDDNAIDSGRIERQRFSPLNP
jgi:hypothetical protein